MKAYDFKTVNRIFNKAPNDEERLLFEDRHNHDDVSREIVYREYRYEWNACGVCTNFTILTAKRKEEKFVEIRMAKTRNGFGCSVEYNDGIERYGFFPRWKDCISRTPAEAVARLKVNTKNKFINTTIREASVGNQLSLF